MSWNKQIFAENLTELKNVFPVEMMTDMAFMFTHRFVIFWDTVCFEVVSISS